MNEITRIHLGRQSFTIAVDAHKVLQEYLQAIKKAVGSSHKEVVDEVELRMAELLLERGITSEKVVIASDISYLQEQLGKPGDFSESEATEGEVSEDLPGDKNPEEDERVQKRLFRDTQHAVIAGVLSGLGAYLGISVLLTRLLFVLFTLVTSGIGVLVYVILWLATPPARTQSERLQMQGRPVTVDSLKELVDQADVEGTAQRAGRKVEPVIINIFKIFLAIIGVGFVLAGVLTWIAAIAGGSFLLVTGINIDGMHVFPLGLKENLLVMCGLVLVAIVAVTLHFVGMAAIKRRGQLRGWITGLMAGLFLLFASIGAALAINVAPDIDNRKHSLRQEVMLTQPAFKQLRVQGTNEFITFEQSDRYAVELSYIGQTGRDFSKLATVKDGVLTINTNEAQRPKSCSIFCLDPLQASIKVYAPSLEAVQIDSDSYVNFSKPVTQDRLTITARSDGSFDLQDVRIGSISIEDGRNDGYITVVATGIREKLTPSYQSPDLSIGDAWVRLNDVDEINLVTDPHGCEAGEYFVSMDQAPKVLRVNGVQLDPLTLQSGEEAAPKHCLQLQ